MIEKDVVQALDALTSNTNTGEGVFDRFMNAVEGHIREEYDRKRITGASYAQTYLGALQPVIQASTQFVLGASQLEAQRRLIEAQIKEQEAKAKLVEAQIRLVEKQIEQAEYEKEYTKWRAVTEQAQTQKIVAIGKNTVDQPVGGTNVFGAVGANTAYSAKQAWALERDAEQKFLKTAVIDVFTTIQSSEGVGANKFGINGSNAISILNKCRREIGISEIDTSNASFNANSQQYKDKWAPNASDEG